MICASSRQSCRDTKSTTHSIELSVGMSGDSSSPVIKRRDGFFGFLFVKAFKTAFMANLTLDRMFVSALLVNSIERQCDFTREYARLSMYLALINLFSAVLSGSIADRPGLLPKVVRIITSFTLPLSVFCMIYFRNNYYILFGGIVAQRLSSPHVLFGIMKSIKTRIAIKYAPEIEVERSWLSAQREANGGKDGVASLAEKPIQERVFNAVSLTGEIFGFLLSAFIALAALLVVGDSPVLGEDALATFRRLEWLLYSAVMGCVLWMSAFSLADSIKAFRQIKTQQKQQNDAARKLLPDDNDNQGGVDGCTDCQARQSLILNHPVAAHSPPLNAPPHTRASMRASLLLPSASNNHYHHNHNHHNGSFASNTPSHAALRRSLVVTNGGMPSIHGDTSSFILSGTAAAQTHPEELLLATNTDNHHHHHHQHLHLHDHIHTNNNNQQNNTTVEAGSSDNDEQSPATEENKEDAPRMTLWSCLAANGALRSGSAMLLIFFFVIVLYGQAISPTIADRAARQVTPSGEGESSPPSSSVEELTLSGNLCGGAFRNHLVQLVISSFGITMLNVVLKFGGLMEMEPRRFLRRWHVLLVLPLAVVPVLASPIGSSLLGLDISPQRLNTVAPFFGLFCLLVFPFYKFSTFAQTPHEIFGAYMGAFFVSNVLLMFAANAVQFSRRMWPVDALDCYFVLALLVGSCFLAFRMADRYYPPVTDVADKNDDAQSEDKVHAEEAREPQDEAPSSLQPSVQQPLLAANAPSVVIERIAVRAPIESRAD